MPSRTLIIAEAGVNHNGDLSLAKQLIDVASDAGADLIKFQTFNAERLVTRTAAKAGYQLEATGSGESQLEMLRRLELDEDAHRQLIEYCAKRKVGFFSTAFDVESVDQLIQLGVRQFKIPSGEITNLPYLRHIGRLGTAVILSTGMATMDEIRAALEILEDAGTPRSQITVLHCTTEYPTPMSEVNLRAMQSIASAFGVGVGYSDHTRGIEVAIGAVALGACVIEKHFTLSRDLPGPDHKASLEPDELKAMVAAIRNIEFALGDGVKRVTDSENRNRPVARKSLVARVEIKAGTAYSVHNITSKRPGTGISPMLWDEVIGRTAPRDYSIDEMIEL
jgi:N,N'-diacetyllegionaminate synthase